LDTATRTVQARIEVANPNGVLRPGMLARAEIETSPGDVAPVLAVPEDAVMTMEGESIVFLPDAKESGLFKKREIQAGPAVAGWTPVRSGLAEGEKIVIRGAAILKAQLARPEEE